MIFSTALAHFRDRGFDEVSVSKITHEAGVAKGTFFNHFRSKDMVLSEYLSRTVDLLFSEIGDQGHSGTGAILAFADALLDRLLADPHMARALVPRLGSLPPAREGEPTGMERVRDWIGRRLSETLPLRVPLVDAPHPSSIPSSLTWALRGQLEDWVRSGTQGGKTLRKGVRRELGFLLASAGLPAE